jgi:DNA alkylation repair enzyme
MPAIDLARLKKQTARLADIFDQPNAFLRELREVLEFYVNRTLRSQSVAPSSVLPTYRTPVVVLRQIETEIGAVAERQPIQALELADALWDEGWLETRLLAAFLLGRIPPQEERLLARLTAWTQAVRDPEVRAALLTTSLTRLRKETPDLFLILVKEWLHPARQRMWSNGIQALVPLISSPDFDNLPPIFEIVEPIIKASPGTLQFDLQELITVLYEASPEETIYFLQQILKESKSPLPAVALRRMSPELPPELQSNLREMLRKAKTR